MKQVYKVMGDKVYYKIHEVGAIKMGGTLYGSKLTLIQPSLSHYINRQIFEAVHIQTFRNIVGPIRRGL